MRITVLIRLLAAHRPDATSIETLNARNALDRGDLVRYKIWESKFVRQSDSGRTGLIDVRPAAFALMSDPDARTVMGGEAENVWH